MDDVWRTIGEVLAAALCVIGLYAAVRWIGEVFLTARPITAAVMIRTRAELASLDLLLAEADRHSLRTRGHPVVVLIDRALLDTAGGTTAETLAEKSAPFGAIWYPADLCGQADEGTMDG